jgi:hypothetical protein
MPSRNTHLKLDWIKVDSSQNMLNFPWINGMTLPFSPCKCSKVTNLKTFIQFNHIFDISTIESKVAAGNLPNGQM